MSETKTCMDCRHSSGVWRTSTCKRTAAKDPDTGESKGEPCARVRKSIKKCGPAGKWHTPKPSKPLRSLGPNGPTGHGDICHSDADSGL